jgi:hypothetical protein
MISGAIILLVVLEPFGALGICLLIWLFTFVIISMLPPRIVDTNLWSCCSVPVNLIGAYPIRWFLFITMVIIALVIGAPFKETLLVMGGLFVYDVIIVFTRGA